MLIRRKKFIKTPEIAERWGYSLMHTLRLLKNHGVENIVLGSPARPRYRWVERDVLRAEQKIFGANL
jgi:hypothetical protein